MKGTVTAGNSSQMSDGAAAAVVMSEARAKSLGAKPLARFVAYGKYAIFIARDGDNGGLIGHDAFFWNKYERICGPEVNADFAYPHNL